MPEIISKQFAEDGDWFTAGKLSIPDGKIVIGDPFGYIYREDFSQRLILSMESGEYPVQIAYIQSELVGLHLCTLRLKILNTPAVNYEPAHSAYEEDVFNPENHFIGFPVKRGYIAFVCAEGAAKYRKFIGKWLEKNPDKRFYDKFFSFLLDDVEEDEVWDGDFIEWRVPRTDHNMFIAMSGFGNGFFIPFFGFDSDNRLCEITVPLIDTDYIQKEEERYKKIWDGAEFCIVTNHILHGHKVGYMYRDYVSNTFSDSGWRFFEGNENGNFEETLSNSSLMSIYDIAEHDPSVIPYLRSPYGTALFRNENGFFQEDDKLMNSW